METISAETQNPHHADYGMFVLVIMSHGRQNGHICGVDGETVKLANVYNLLSARNFPGMSGKPKFIIVQACGGSKFIWTIGI